MSYPSGVSGVSVLSHVEYRVAFNPEPDISKVSLFSVVICVVIIHNSNI